MYLDPGFGGMLVQVIVVLIAAGGATLFAFRKKVAQLFKKDKTKGKQVTVHEENMSDIVDTLSDEK